MSAITASDSILHIAPALAAAQAAIGAASKDSRNPHFNSKYADLASVWEAFRSSFAAHQLALIQAPAVNGNHVVLETRILHGSGEWIAGSIEALAKDASPQSIGSVVTYLRRYGVCALVGIVADEDDDGNSAQTERPRHEPRPNRPAPAALRQVAAPAPVAPVTPVAPPSPAGQGTATNPPAPATPTRPSWSKEQTAEYRQLAADIDEAGGKDQLADLIAKNKSSPAADVIDLMHGLLKILLTPNRVG